MSDNISTDRFSIKWDHSPCIIVPSHETLEKRLAAIKGKHALTIANEARLALIQYLVNGVWSFNSHRFRGCWGGRALQAFDRAIEGVTSVVGSHISGVRSTQRSFTLPLVTKCAPDNDSSVAVPATYLRWIKITTSWLDIRHVLWSRWIKSVGGHQHVDLDGSTDWGRAYFAGLDSLELPIKSPEPSPERVERYLSDNRGLDDCHESTQRRLDTLQTGVPRVIRRKHGRAYHAATGLPREVRRESLLGGEPVVEVDLSATYWAILVSWMPDGPEKNEAMRILETGGWYEQFDKRCLAPGQSIKVETQRQCLFWKDNRAESNPLRSQLRAKHPELMAMIELKRNTMSARQLSIELMQAEGEIFVDLGAPAIYASGILLIGNHDGIIVPESKAEHAKAILEAIILKRFGYRPMVKIKRSLSSHQEWAEMRDWIAA